MSEYDLTIRNGLIADGTGGPLFEGHIGIRGGKVVSVGTLDGTGRQDIDAGGLLVTPGFVDIHTHYDGQATWDNRLQPSSWHGVTTVVMGNCGVGFAPCRPDDHDRLIRLMEGVEDIPFPVLAEGLKWNWESFPDYLTALEEIPHDVDFAAQVPHAALRVYVMGERGANREPASEDDIAAMARLAREGVMAGALGFSTSRTLNHRTSDGQPTPTLTAGEDELTGIAKALADAKRGVLQVVSDFDDPQKEAAMLRRIVEASGRPLSISLAQSDVAPKGWRKLLGAIEDAANAGLPIKAQVCGRPVGLLLGLELTVNPFTAHAAYREIASLPLKDRVAKLRDPELRRRLVTEIPASDNPFVKAVLGNYDKMFLMSATPDYEQTMDSTVAAIAARRGTTPADVAIEHMLTEDGRGMLYLPFLNYADGSLDPSYEMMLHKDTVLGLSDGGAHVGIICDGSFPTSMLTHWTRDRTRGPKLPIEWVVKAQTSDTAKAVGLEDRGVLAPGYKADLNIIDYHGLTLFAPEVAYDMPAGGRRLIQRAEGYVATVVSGQITYRTGAPTQALPGKLIRGAQTWPFMR